MKRKVCFIMLCSMLFLNACGASADKPATDNDANTETLSVGTERTQSVLFEGFYVGEKVIDDETVPVLYNDDMQLVFMGDYIELTKNDTQESYNVELPTCSCGISITLGRMQIEWADVNQDNVDDLIFTETFTGTGRMQMVDVVDGKSMDVIPFHYTVEDLAEYLPNFKILEENTSKDDVLEEVVVEYEVQGKKYTYAIEVGLLDASSREIVVDTNSQDYRYCSEDGVITVETGFGFAIQDSVNVDIVGILRGELVYQQEADELILDEDSIQVEWIESQEP